MDRHARRVVSPYFMWLSGRIGIMTPVARKRLFIDTETRSHKFLPEMNQLEVQVLQPRIQ